MHNRSITLSIAACAAFLASCGAGGIGDIGVGANNATGTTGACQTDYYREILGTYTGTLTRDEIPYVTDLLISGKNDSAGYCDLAFNLESDGEWSNGNFETWVDIPGYDEFWNDPSWPIDGGGYLVSATKQVGVIGRAGEVAFGVSFYGDGTLTIEDNGGYLVKE